jgi:hypothetical protein
MGKQKASQVVGSEIGFYALVGENDAASCFRGVQDEAVETRCGFQDLVRQEPHLPHPREIGCRQPEVGIRYALTDSVSSGRATLAGTRPDQDPCTALGELGGNRLAKSARRARDEESGRSRLISSNKALFQTFPSPQLKLKCSVPRRN